MERRSKMIEIVPKEFIENMIVSANSDTETVCELAGMVEATQIENQKDLESAVKLIAVLMDARDEYTEKCEGWTKPLNEVVDSIKETFFPAIDTLKEVEKMLKKKIDSAFKEFEEESNRLLEQVESVGPEQRAIILKRCEEIVLDKVSGLSMRANKKNVLENEFKTVEWAIKEGRVNLLKIDQKALNEVIASFIEPPSIPGVKYEKTNTVVITRSRIEV
jgi:predicted HAD superfamily phosphohydrolase